jgi:tetratricopeptide (TPR) repeat protein/tRNA A-37 threonylcarbamoyl transferase component Bud32
MKCPACHAQIENTTGVCGYCGAPLPGPASDLPSTHVIPIPSLEPLRGTVFAGRYVILRELGRGGMGVVYEAEQQNPRRAVALKVIRGGSFVDELRVRLFQREAQALARLKHPRIAAVYESGCTEDGRHFFAMELVRGETLTAFLARDAGTGGLSADQIRRRLELFREVCDAVSYAHQRGIIHRDLKPSNVLVTHDAASTSGRGDVPEIKILDFGLARITDTDVEMSSIVTEAGKVYGTVPYMSPEQFRGNTDEIDIRTDVYSLGVMLFELLTGRLPYDASKKAFPEAARIVCEEQPAPLGRDWLGTRRPDSDLQTIVGKVLEKEPTRRYQNVAALSEDLERYLHGQPILARPPSALYQLRKMIVRHKIGFAFSAALLVLIAGFAVSMAVLSARLAAERDRAEREVSRAGAINEFLQDTLGSANPVEGQGRDVTVLEALRAATAKVDGSFAGQPDVKARVLHTIGLTYLRLGHYEDAERVLQASVSAWRQAHGRDDVSLSEPLTSLGVVYHEQGDYRRAESLYREALALRQSKGLREDPDTLSILNNLAQVLQDQRRYGEAEALDREILAVDRRIFGPNHEHVATDLNNLGHLLNRQGRYAESEPLLREAVAALRSLRSPWLPVAAGNLGETLIHTGRAAEAEPLLARALADVLRDFGPDNQDVAKIRVKYGECLHQLGRDAEAETQWRTALPILEGSLGPEDELTRRVAHELADLDARKSVPPANADEKSR